MRLFTRSLALVALLAPPLAAQQQQTENAFSYNAKVQPGRWLTVRNLSGAITVGQASGENVEVTATKRWRRGDPTVVHFETKKYGPGEENVLICALWGERSTCDESGYSSQRDDRDRDRGTRNNDLVVDFRVLVPRGVKLGVHTINGDVTVDGATSDIEAGTINGEVSVDNAQGRVRATNINGGVRARLAKLESDGRMEFTTVNGSVSLELPADASADLEMQTLSGTVNTNFEMTVSGRFEPKRICTHVGRPGGPRIRLHTIHGSIDVKRR